MLIKIVATLAIIFAFSEAYCPPDQFRDTTGKCLDKSYCSLKGVNSGRFYVEDSQCRYCDKHFIRKNGKCEECKGNEFGKLSENHCSYSVYSCSEVKGVVYSRMFIKDHLCGFCDIDSEMSVSKCKKCEDNQFGLLSDNSCHSRSSCKQFDKNFSEKRLVVTGHICTNCPMGTYQSSGNCKKCGSDTFTELLKNECESKRDCPNKEKVNIDRIFIKDFTCQFCGPNFFNEKGNCKLCRPDTFADLSKNKCQKKDECSNPQKMTLDRISIVQHQCTYCEENFFLNPEGKKIQCPRNTFTDLISNKCRGVDDCPVDKNVSKERVYIENHSCKVCPVNTVLKDGICVKCNSSFFAPLESNECFSRKQCSPRSEISLDRYYVHQYECKYCQENFFFDGKTCQECNQDQRSPLDTNNCLGVDSCDSILDIKRERMVIQLHKCTSCNSNEIQENGSCVKCLQNSFTRNSDNECLTREKCPADVGIALGRYYISNYNCKFCEKDSIFSEKKCTKCLSDTFGQLADNTCHTRKECPATENVSLGRYYVSENICMHCKKTSSSKTRNAFNVSHTSSQNYPIVNVMQDRNAKSSQE
jgi:hypothetical protein